MAGARGVKVLHTLGWYFPESSGGTEVYVDGLVRNLPAFGVDPSVAAASADGTATTYAWHGVPVARYPVPDATRREIVDALPHGRFSEFADWLRGLDVDVYHQHSWTRGCGLAHLRLAKELGFKTVLTIHVAGALCLRGTMMLDGAGPCDGEIIVGRCTRCWGTSRGIPGAIAGWQGRNPGASNALGRLLPLSRASTALLTPSLVERRQADMAEIGRVADRVVAVSRWLHDAVALNGIPREKLIFCPQGIDLPAGFRRPERTAGAGDLRVGFLGRWDPMKGVHILVDAFRQLPASAYAQLFIHGLPFDASYERDVRARAEGDPRIHIEAPVDRRDLFQALAGFDVLAVPSLALETGPLVVLEAFAAGTPVLGSNLGGIAELVEPNVSGRLLPAGDVAAWSQAIAAMASSPGSVRAQLIPPPPSSSRRIAEEMSAVYHELVSPRQFVAREASLARHNG